MLEHPPIMMNLLDKHSKDSTALKHVVDPESRKNMATKEAKTLTYFVLKRHCFQEDMVKLNIS